MPKFRLISWYGNFAQFQTNHSKLCGNCAFLQNFHTRKLGEITVICVVHSAFSLPNAAVIHTFTVQKE